MKKVPIGAQKKHPIFFFTTRYLLSETDTKKVVLSRTNTVNACMDPERTKEDINILSVKVSNWKLTCSIIPHAPLASSPSVHARSLMSSMQDSIGTSNSTSSFEMLIYAKKMITMIQRM